MKIGSGQNMKRAMMLMQSGIRCIRKDGVHVFINKIEGRLMRDRQYQRWLMKNENVIPMRQHFNYKPLISVIMPVYNVKSNIL